MIPVRVGLKNFLCFDTDDNGDPLVFDFDGSNLWSIAGDNGAGKSAVFDAVRYALFGHHRGGRQRDHRLVRKGTSRCEVTFEFDLGGRLYRIGRTVPANEKGEKTYQAAWYDLEAGDWRSIPETGSRTGLDSWVKQTLRLDARTFTASTMLLQGESDRLLKADAEDRFDILGGLLDLGLYKKLESLARDRAKTGRRRKKDLETEIRMTQPVSKDDIENAQADVHKADEAIAAESKTRDASLLVEKEAREHFKLSKDARDLQSILRDLAKLLRNRDRIEKSFLELSEIKGALPKLEKSLAEVASAQRQEEAALQALEELNEIDMDALAREEREAKKEAQQIAKSCSRLKVVVGEYVDAVPMLRRVIDARMRVEEVVHASDTLVAGRDLSSLKRETEAVAKRVLAERDQASRVAATKTKELASVEASLSAAEAELAERLGAKDEGTCSRCGQPVDAKHIASEVAELRSKVRELKASVREKQKQEREAQKEHKTISGQLEKARADALKASDLAAQVQRLAKEEKNRLQKLDLIVAQATSKLPSKYHKPYFKGDLSNAEKQLDSLEAKLGKARVDLKNLEQEEQAARKLCETTAKALSDAIVAAEKLRSRAEGSRERAQSLREQAASRLESINEKWQANVVEGDGRIVDWLREHARELESVEKQYADLQKAATKHEEMKRKLERVEEARQAIPRKSRIDPDEAARKLKEAQDRVATFSAQRDAARDLVGHLNNALQTRSKLEEKVNAVAREVHLLSRLVDLLGRSGLQAVLIDDAVRGIGQLANETLARISGGSLQLWILRRPGRGGKEEIVIEATDLSLSDDRLDIDFISGGQKFRTAVSLAAAIGQYVGGPGSVHSLIIDEGFGSLDAQGRQETVDELRNLSRVMDRIIVVSHQEDFQDRALFPTGYVLTKQGRRTLVERFV